jgi:hypothetical protein
MATVFGKLLRERNSDPANRRWIYVPYDQLSDRMGPLLLEDPHELGIILMENPAKAARRLYWAFLERHAEKLRANPRLMPMMRALRRRSAEEKRKDAETYNNVLEQLQSSAELEP